MSVGVPQRQIGDHYKIRADVMAEMVKLDQEQRAEIARLRDVNTDLQAQIVRMEAVVQAARKWDVGYRPSDSRASRALHDALSALDALPQP